MSRWAALVHRRRWLVFLVAAGLMLIAGAWGAGVMNRLGMSGATVPGSESDRVGQLVEQHFGRQSPDIVALYTAPAGQTPADIGAEVQQHLAKIDHSLLAQSPLTYWNAGPLGQQMLLSRDGRTAAAAIFVAGDQGQRVRAYDEIAPALQVPGVHTEVTGFTAVAAQINTQSEKDLAFAETVSIPVALVVLVFVFGGLVAASLPVLVGGLAIAGALGALRAMSEFTDVNVFAVNIASLLALGLAIDYGLFVVGRYREELAAGADSVDALTRALGTAGRTIGFSALLLVCAFAGTLVFPQGELKSLGYGAMSAVVAAALMSLTVLPASLAILGPRIDALSWRKSASTRGEERAERIWGRIADSVLRRPGIVAGVIIVGLLLLATPLLGVRLGDIDQTALPKSSVARQNIEALGAEFPASNSGITVVLRSDGPQPPTAREVAEVNRQVRRVHQVQQVVEVGSAANFVVLHAALAVPDGSQSALAAVHEVREIAAPTGTQVLIGGQSAATADSVASIKARIPLMIAVMVAATLVLMMLAFRSVVLPIKAVLMAFLSLGSAFGLLTLIFFDGHLAGLLGISQGPLAAGMVVLIISVVFGLSTDYEVFLISRMIEARQAGADTATAVRIGMIKTGRIVTAAATLLVIVTGAFALSSLTPMKFLGIGMILALIIDATLVRMLLVPALVKLMGEANWWFPRLPGERWRGERRRGEGPDVEPQRDDDRRIASSVSGGDGGAMM